MAVDREARRWREELEEEVARGIAMFALGLGVICFFVLFLELRDPKAA